MPGLKGAVAKYVASAVGLQVDCFLSQYESKYPSTRYLPNTIITIRNIETLRTPYYGTLRP